MSNHVIKPVKLLAEWDAPAMLPVPVRLRYCEGGEAKSDVMPTAMPIRFDKVVVSCCEEELPAVEFGSAGFGSPKNAARSVYFAARKWRQKFGAARRFESAVLDLRAVEPNNVAHLMTDIIPRYLLVKKVVGDDVTLLLKRAPVGSFAELLELFGVTYVVETGRVQGNVVQLRGMRGLSVVEMFDNFDTYGIHFYSTVFSDMGFKSELGLEKIFLARRAPRDLENHAAIEAVIQKYGYKTIYMEDYSVAEQMGIGANAKHVIAIHGAAMSFLAANKWVGSVVEFFPPNVHHEFFANLFGAKVGKYFQMLPSFDMQVQLSGWPAVLSFKNQRFPVNPETLDEVLREVHGTKA